MPITFGKGGNGDSPELRWMSRMNAVHRQLVKVKNARFAGKPDLAGEKKLMADLDKLEAEVKEAQAKAEIKFVEDLKSLLTQALSQIVPKFPTGRLVATAGIDAEIKRNPAFSDFVGQCMQRHIHGDWGDLTQEDKKANDAALKEGNRLLSAYEQKPFPKIWIITEWNRSVTTVLFPEEY